MANNLIPIIAKELGVEIGEEFTLENFEEERFKFDNKLLRYWADSDEWEIAEYGILIGLVYEYHKIKKLPFEPKEGEEYWSYWQNWAVTNFRWGGGLVNECFRKATGCIFRTKEEAVAALPAKYKEITGKEWKE